MSKIKPCTGSKLRELPLSELQKNYLERLKQSANAYLDMQNSSIVSGKSWLAANNEVCEVCTANQDAGVIKLRAKFPSGHEYPQRVLIAVVFSLSRQINTWYLLSLFEFSSASPLG